MELSREATNASPREAEYWNTFGVALYRNGDAQGAIAALPKASSYATAGTHSIGSIWLWPSIATEMTQ